MLTSSYRQNEINAYIYGSQRLTNMVQSDLKLLQQDTPYNPIGYDRQGFIVLMDNDDMGLDGLD